MRTPRLGRILVLGWSLASSALGQVQQQIAVEQHERDQKLTWHDEDDVLSGQLTPGLPEAGRPVVMTFALGALYGKDQGTVRAAVRHNGVTVLEQALTRGPHMKVVFTPDEPGDYAVDLIFQSTRLKMIHLPVSVGESEPSKWWGVGMLAMLAAAGGVWVWSNRARPAKAAEAGENAPAVEPGPTTMAPVAKPTETAAGTGPESS